MRRARNCSVWARVHTLSQLDNLRGIGYHSLMTRKLQELQHEILQLPEKDRIRLVEQLIASLDGEDDTDAEGLWLREAEERYRAYRQGKVESRSASEALRDARSSLE